MPQRRMYKRPAMRRYKKSAARKTSTKKIARVARRVIRAQAERIHSAAHVSANIDNDISTSVRLLQSAFSQGDGSQNRQGDTISLTSLELNLVLTLQPYSGSSPLAQTGPVSCRIMLLQFKQAVAAAPTSVTVFEDQTYEVQSPLIIDPAFRNQFYVVYDRVVTLKGSVNQVTGGVVTAASGDERVLRIRLTKFPMKKIKYVTGSTTQMSGALYFFIVTNNGAGVAPVITARYNYRLNAIDI